MICRLWQTPGNLALFSPEEQDNEGRGENHLVLRKPMLLTGGLKEGETALLVVVGWEERNRWQVGCSLHNENGQTDLSEHSHYTSLRLTNCHPPPASTAPIILQNYPLTCLCELKQCLRYKGKSECFPLYWRSPNFSVMYFEFFLSAMRIN